MSVRLSVHGGGVPHLARRGGGVPQPGGLPQPGPAEGVPHLAGGVPHLVGGYPSPVQTGVPHQVQMGVPPGRGTSQQGYPPPQYRTTNGVLDTPRSVCLLRSRRRTVLLLIRSIQFASILYYNSTRGRFFNKLTRLTVDNNIMSCFRDQILSNFG